MAKVKASNFRQQVQKLHDLLAKRLDHHTKAFKSLLSEEGTPVLSKYFSEEALNEWSAAFAKDKKDWIACHHLAVMYHSQAFELEAMGQTKDARSYWIKASQYWRELIRLGEPFATLKTAFGNSLEIKDIDKLIEEIERHLPFSFLLIHHRLYQEYLAHHEEERAEIHFELMEDSVFPEASKVLEDAYIQKYGRLVWSLNNECIGLTEKRLLSKANTAREFLGQIKKVLKKRPTFLAALNDLCILQALMVRIKVHEWEDAALKRYNNTAQLRDEHDGLVRELERIQKQLETPGRSEAFTSQAVFLKKYQRYQEISEKLSQAVRDSSADIANITPVLKECYQGFSSLTAQRASLNIELIEAVRSAIRSIEIIVTRGFAEKAEYLALRETADKFLPLMRIEQAKFSSAVTQNKMTEQGIWHWTDLKAGLHPYARTIFLLAASDMPVLTESLNIKELIKSIKLNMVQKSLVHKANAGKHIVYGRRVEATDLNAVQAVLDKADHSTAEAVVLAKHMLLQHQAHSMECTDILTGMESLVWPDFKQEPINMTPGILTLFSGIPIARRQQRSWHIQDTEKLKLPRPVIIWPV